MKYLIGISLVVIAIVMVLHFTREVRQEHATSQAIQRAYEPARWQREYNCGCEVQPEGSW